MEELENEFRLLIGAYYGVQMMDGYDLKVYVLNDIQEEQKKFLREHPLPNFDIERESQIIQNGKLASKLQDALIVLNRIDASRELIHMIRTRLKEETKKDK